MAHVTKEIIVKNPLGLHARPAALFVQIALKFNSEVTIEKDGERINGKSIMGILTLGIQQNSKIIIEVDGDDAQKALPEFEELLSKENIDE